MALYSFSVRNPSTQLIDIEFISSTKGKKVFDVMLPCWRPGRYERGNFAKNIIGFKVVNEKGESLSYKKVNSHQWRIDSHQASEIKVTYSYYGAELNAGSSWLDASQLYVNPVNCCVYHPDDMAEACEVQLHIPKTYEVAVSEKVTELSSNQALKTVSFSLPSYHQLADTPFIASAELLHNMFILDGVEFHIWIQGEYKPDWPKIIGDFFIFINEQFVMMREFPSTSFHFLIQVLPYNFYHGVEHLKSTVIAIGPGHQLNRKVLYDELLGVCSHELIHVWNVKSFRPAEMWPYDYQGENFSELGFVYEGCTTYYGDLMLYRSGIFSDDDYFKTFNEQLQKHFDNPGRFNLSVAESSIDTWIDGYVQGTPNRKVSIYTEGCLLAFIADACIRKQTNNDFSLDEVMRRLYQDFAKNNKGYTMDDYKAILEKITSNNWDDYFNQLVTGTNDYQPHLKEALSYFGLEISLTAASKPYEAFLGFKLIDNNGDLLVSSIFPGSAAEQSGLMLKDKLISVNDFEIKGNFNEWCNHFWPDEFVLTVLSNGKHKKLNIVPGKKLYYKTYSLVKLNNATDEQKQNFKKWTGRNY
jgi:predicted metalloprotease with PDZ domain